MIKYFSMSRKSLFEHKLRSFLTMLGIIFGVSAVISMMSIGEGAKREALAEIQKLGINNIYLVDKKEERKNAFDSGSYVGSGITMQDINYISSQADRIESWAVIKEKECYVQSEYYNNMIKVSGVSSRYWSVLELEAGLGRLFGELDIQKRHKVCVCGPELYKKIFRGGRGKGLNIRINNNYYQVAGVLAHKPGFTEELFIPVHNQLLYENIEPFSSAVSKVIFYIKELKYVSTAAAFIRQAVKRRHNNIEDFNLIVPESLLKQSERTKNIFNIVMILITGISLIVGGIGIMNIMLASVLERTKEIGIRRAIGATRRDIRMQFLIEAVMLCMAGGLTGIILGIALTRLIVIFTGWITHLSLIAVAVSFSISVLIGMIFGYYPAKNASELNPIDALRYE